MTDILLIAYGNPLRRDDGAGLALAKQLEQRWCAEGIRVQRVAMHQLVPELAAEIYDVAPVEVVFVDAATAQATAGIEVREVNPQHAHMSIGHSCGPDIIMYLAQQLYGVEVPARLITIQGSDFGHGEGLSQAVEMLLERADHIEAISCTLAETDRRRHHELAQ